MREDDTTRGDPNITRRGGPQRGARCGVSVSRSPRAARRPARWRGGAGWRSPPAAARGEARRSMLGGCTGGCTGGRARANAGWGGAGGKRGSRAAVRRARLQQVLCSRRAEASRRLRVQAEEVARLQLARQHVPTSELHLQPPLQAVVRGQVGPAPRDLRELGSGFLVEALQRRERLGLQLQLDAIKHLLGRRSCSCELWPYKHSRIPAP